jgi:hypothetical protein
MASPQQHFDAARRFQEYYDGVLRDIGARAPQPVLGQSVNDTGARHSARSSARSFRKTTTFTKSITVVSKLMRSMSSSLSF